MSDRSQNSAATWQPSPSLPPPVATTGAVGWIRSNLFSGPLNTIMTLIGIAIVIFALPPILNFVLFDAVWSGEDREACIGDAIGACWAAIGAKFGFFVYGFYPEPERWRVDIFFALLFGGIIWLMIERMPYRRNVVIFMLFILPIITYFLLTGGLGMTIVETSVWGGFMVTIVVAVVGIVASLPLGIVLALGRRSSMPFVRMVSIVFIEFWRGVPLITVLFMASVMLPLFLPEGWNFDKLLRALIGVALFSAAYMAEVIRGGLQAIPRGQYEAGDALGLTYWQKTGLIILPQALKLVIPGIVNTFIGLFKDTTLVLIIGLFDLLGAVQSGLSDPNWSSPTTAISGYLFAAFGFWIFCFGMSRYSIFMERKLDTGHKR